MMLTKSNEGIENRWVDCWWKEFDYMTTANNTGAIKILKLEDYDDKDS